MLNEEEEIKLNTITKIIETSKDFSEFPKLNAYEIEWLAEKCKELNEELKRKKLYSPKNEISDRFYPK